jgi:tRNA A-37 threonylcarbamoyl transferase component Bud32
MLSFALVFVSVTMASVVALFGEERRVKLWFVTTCIACATLSAGLWVEVNRPDWTIAAARVNMTAALALAASGLLSTLAMARLRVSRPILAVLGIAAVVNVATVWVSDLYFSGEILHYSWGIYVGADPWFIANPLLVALIAGYAVVLLARNYREAHPLDKNRAKYLFAGFTTLALSVIDYLPHFGIDPLGPPIGGVFDALFLFLFGYACLRYRLVVFRDLVGRGLGWGIAFGAMALAYAFALEGARRFGASATSSPLIGTLAAAGVYASLGRTVPDWTQRVFGLREPDYARAIGDYSDAITTNFDEHQIIASTMTICATTFGTRNSAYLEGVALEREMVPLGGQQPVPFVEVEVLRRSRAVSASASYELFLPISRHGALVGALAIGPRNDDRMYSRHALEALRTLANVLGIAIVNARAGAELVLLNDELRRQVTDRSRQLAEALQRVGAVPARDSDIGVGKRIDDRYEVVRQLGSGGVGTVFEVIRLRDARRFALKVLRLASTGISLARLAREAEVAGQIKHPNLVSIVDVDVSKHGELYLVMELVDGVPLSGAQKHFGDVRWAVPILRQIARGLAALHAGGIVHRDLKPGNLLLSGNAHIKIADFGLARLSRAPTNPVVEAPASDSEIASAPTLAARLVETPSGDLTEQGEIMGTPLYMAPELVAGAKDALPSSDIWSFGVVAYQLLVGKPPFKSVSVRTASHARAQAETAFGNIANLPRPIAGVLARTLAAGPHERPTAAELADALAES